MKEIPVQELKLDPLMIVREWMLITAGTKERGYNTMTASGGHLGSIWGGGKCRPSAVVYVRPQRYTKEFMDREELFTLSFFPEGYRDRLGYLGTHSGRDGDKIAEAGLTPVFSDGYTGFAEARLTLLCRKLYQGRLQESGFADRRIIEDNYPEKDFHEMYIGEIIRAWEK